MKMSNKKINLEFETFSISVFYKRQSSQVKVLFILLLLRAFTSNSAESSDRDDNSGLSISDCMEKYWNNCSCVGFTTSNSNASPEKFSGFQIKHSRKLASAQGETGKMEDTKSKLQEGSAVESLTTTTYCVTGATGYIGSWLVKSLLQRGYRVHATVRNQAKTLHLLPLWGGGDRLRVFRADLHKEGSFNEAVQGCSGVFHVAASMEFEVPAKEDIELEDSYVSANVIEPAINGTLNLLKSCLKTPSVRRVVFTSSISTMTAKDSAGKWRSVVDESCQNPIDRVWKTKTGAWVYVLSKLLTEEAAFKFANESSIDLVSVITTTVAGPFLTSTVPTSVQVLLSPITGSGDSKFSRILSAVNSRMGSIALVHIEDICSAHIFLMEHDGAEGRYICSAHSSVISQLVDHLAKEHPFSNMQRLVEEEHGSVPSEISSKKLRDLGFNFKFGLEDIIHHTVSSCVDCGFLCPTAN
ncbi:unnamed protein product [Camellia sinensis]